VGELVWREAHPPGHLAEASPEAWGIYHPRSEDEH